MENPTDLQDAVISASLKRRAIARIADLTTVGAWIWALSATHILFFIPMLANKITPGPWGNWFVLIVTFVTAFIAYEALFIHKTGSTPGKDLMKLRVVSADNLGAPSLEQAIKRTLPVSLVWLVPFWWAPPALTALLGMSGLANKDPKSTNANQLLHDQLSGTRVITFDPIAESDLEPDEAAAERTSQFITNFTDPIQVLPGQILNHPGAPELQSQSDLRSRRDR